MIVVKFGSVDEFVSELVTDSNKIDRAIVRVVFRTALEQPMPMRSLTLIASAIVDGKLVRLERRVGSFFEDSTEADRVRAEGEKLADMIRQAAADMKLEIRSGVFEAA
jgi:chromosome condensin MukBEF complex kleisin-like MukF subunit